MQCIHSEARDAQPRQPFDARTRMRGKNRVPAHAAAAHTAQMGNGLMAKPDLHASEQVACSDGVRLPLLRDMPTAGSSVTNRPIAPPSRIPSSSHGIKTVVAQTTSAPQRSADRSRWHTRHTCFVGSPCFLALYPSAPHPLATRAPSPSLTPWRWPPQFELLGASYLRDGRSGHSPLDYRRLGVCCADPHNTTASRHALAVFALRSAFRRPARRSFEMGQNSLHFTFSSTLVESSI
jgi:hypothetical protein